jgi:hypothetical protein
MRFAAALLFLALAAGGCGETSKSSGSDISTFEAATPGAGTKLTESDIPDVLLPGIWPNSETWTVERNGDTVTVQTDWNRGDTTVDGRDVTDASQSICAVIPPDLSNFNVSVDVLAADGTPLASKGNGDDTCHAE